MMSDSKSNSQYVDFFVKEEKPIPTTFFKEFSFSSKKEGVSNWYTTLRKSLKIYNDDPTLNEIKQNYVKGHYRCVNNHLPEENDKQKPPKKPCLRESNQEIINQGNSSINLDFDHFKTQELLNNKKGIVIYQIQAR
ncbi:unnamed protein product [Rhizophagus irregularis]|uniref:Uncharacterized protein n=1 Tax=Rhizophagus irregularis TaxID=588596 RepID=A0A915ZKV7_9GLOM|nr:unnamed protein product [Rhizophagus irregularis]